MSSLLMSPKEYFAESVKNALAHRKVQTYPQVEMYLVNLLEFYLDAKNLFESEYDEAGNKNPKTLAELFLVASNSESQRKAELLKKLGDKSLYISGFFGDSLERKIVDIDYYADMGCTAYATLAKQTKEDIVAKTYSEISKKFIDYADVLTYISQSSMVQSNQSVLRLYERYLRTGSNLAKEKLLEMGVLPVSKAQAKKSRQF